MQQIVIIADGEKSAEKLYSIAKSLFPDCEIHFVTDHDKNIEKKSPHMSWEDNVKVSRQKPN